SSALVASPTATDTVAPTFLSSSAVASSLAALRPAIVTGCPPFANRRAIAAPKLRDAPTPTISTPDFEGSVRCSFIQSPLSYADARAGTRYRGAGRELPKRCA